MQGRYEDLVKARGNVWDVKGVYEGLCKDPWGCVKAPHMCAGGYRDSSASVIPNDETETNRHGDSLPHPQSYL